MRPTRILIFMLALLPPRMVLAQPRIELPPPEPREQPPTTLPREAPVENPLGRAPVTAGSAIGGYGELTLVVSDNLPAVVDLRRVVLYFGHSFAEIDHRLRFYSELEIEHAVSSAGDQGEVEIEQAFLDGLVGRRCNLRGGLILMPVGIVNVYHEPPTFNGVDRPDVDLFIIPSTWREPGAGVFGEITEGLRYQLYLVNGFNANRFTAESAIREGHQEAQLARAGDFGAVVRLDYEPRPGTVFGVSAYGASAGNTLGKAVGRVPVTLLEADARARRGGWTARAELAVLFIGDARALSAAIPMEAAPVSSQARGGYAEIGYDVVRVLAPAETQALTVFGRFDYADTQADVPAGFTANLAFRRTSVVVGLGWRPIPQVALKLDYRRREFGAGPGSNEAASAITWMF